MSASDALTHHGSVRCPQRGLSNKDVDLIELLGLEVPDGYLLCRRDAQRFARLLRKLAGRVETLAGARIVTESGRLITAYRATPGKQKRLLRRAYDHAEAF